MSEVFEILSILFLWTTYKSGMSQKSYNSHLTKKWQKHECNHTKAEQNIKLLTSRIIIWNKYYLMENKYYLPRFRWIYKWKQPILLLISVNVFTRFISHTFILFYGPLSHLTIVVSRSPLELSGWLVKSYPLRIFLFFKISLSEMLVRGRQGD